ncbi:MAG: SDR family NAD(P)-dependent oxidoreductase [Nocardioides sp.]
MTDAPQLPQLIVLTGATAGIGLEAALQLGAQGHHLVLVGRNVARLESAAARVRASGASQVDTLVADHESLDSIRALAAELRAAYADIDVLVNNAGTVYDKRALTEDGFERTFAVNHLSGFLLTELVKDLVRKRIVFTASTGHYAGTLDFDDLGFEQGYSVLKSYSRSKLANVLYARSLAAELEGAGVTVNSLHPGAVATDIWSGAPWYARPLLKVAKLFMVTPEKGGAHLTYLITGPDVGGRTGEYYDQSKLKTASDLALDDDLAARLHEVSADLVGLTK